MSVWGQTRQSGFSLVELVIVVVVIGIIAAIAVPRISRGSQGATEAALEGNLSILRKAVEIYAAEHNGLYPTAAGIEDQLLKYTDLQGNVSDVRTQKHMYGPYLRQLPPLPVGLREGQRSIATSDANDVGWIYEPDSGDIRPNTGDSAVDSFGNLFKNY